MNPDDLGADATQPVPPSTGWVDPLAETKPQRAPHDPDKEHPPAVERHSGRFSWGCRCGCLLPLLGLALFLAVYFLAPLRTNILVLGIDTREEGSDLGRTDTNILATVVPMRPYVGMLSIPRDLWVQIPGQGENRINSAHFFAEAERPGSGPQAAIETVELNFGVPVRYFVRIRFTGLKDVVDALGGVDVDLPQAMSGYPAGLHHMDGEKALAFVRDRQGSDDFFRMARGQLFLKALLEEQLKPANWPRFPDVLIALPQFVDTDIPIWQWPRLALALFRSGPEGIDSRVVGREMVQPFTTSGGAAVLSPKWEAINPTLEEMFGPRATS